MSEGKNQANKMELMPSQEHWLYQENREAWGWYMAWKGTPLDRRGNVKELMPAELKPVLAVAYRKFR